MAIVRRRGVGIKVCINHPSMKVRRRYRTRPPSTLSIYLSMKTLDIRGASTTIPPQHYLPTSP